MRFTVYSNDWFLEKLDNVCQFVRDGTHGSFKDVEIGIPLLSAKDIFDGKININENSRLISIDDYNTIHKNYELTKGDILLTIVGTIGRTAMVNMDEKFTLQRSVAILRVNEQISYNFLYYYIQTSAFQNRLKSVVNQSAQGGVYLNSLKKLNIKLTADMNEQNKISSFLSIIDKKIKLLEQKYQYYQEFKKYLMQKIFAQELRFNFTDDWNYMNFSEIFKSVSTKKYQIKSADILDKGDFEVIDQGQDEIAGYFNDKTKLCQELPIIIYGDHTTFVKFRDKPFIVGADGVKLLIPKFNANPKYLFYALEHFNIKPEGYKRHFSIIKKIKLPIPTLEEQNEISEIFTYIDIKLKYTKIQLQETEEFKKGLLQQMFVVQLILSLLQNKKHI